MKKTYIAPTAEAIELFTEDSILTVSPEACFNNKQEITGDASFLSNKTIWNYNEGNEK